jgi:hypothetical protein
MDLKLVAALAAVMLSAAPAHAQWAVFDAANYARAAEALLVARSQLTAALRALHKLDTPRWRTIAGLVAAADAALPAGAIASAPQATRTYPSAERTAVASTLASLAGALSAADLQRPSLAAGTSHLDAIKAQLPGVQGTQGALELSNTVHVFSAEELVLLRQAVVAQTNAQSVYYGNELTARAQVDESARAVYAGMATTPPRRPFLSLRP